MNRQIIDIANDGYFLQKHRGHIRIEVKDDKTGEVTRKSDVPLDEIEAVIVHGRYGAYSHQSLLTLSEKGIPVVLCDEKHRPVCWVWPLQGNFEQTRRMNAQLSMKAGLKNRLWASIIKEKIRSQGRVLQATTGVRSTRFKKWTQEVRPGDSTNLEAYASSVYWPLLFGDRFVRDRRTPGINARLNYGYTVLRAAVARQLMAAGLHLSVGLFHKNRFDAWCLVDDFMEPFRPLFDFAVWQQVSGQAELSESRSTSEEMDLEVRLSLVDVLRTPVEMNAESTSLSSAIRSCVQSLTSSIMEGKDKLVWPSNIVLTQDTVV